MTQAPRRLLAALAATLTLVVASRRSGSAPGRRGQLGGLRGGMLAALKVVYHANAIVKELAAGSTSAVR